MVEQTVTHPPATISGNINCPATGDNGYCTAAASLSLSGNEPLSGYNIIALEGTHNGATFACAGASCSINLVEGANAFTFWALSDWGDSSLMGNASRGVDTNPPSISGSASGTSGSGLWYVSPVTISASASDPSPGSGMASFQASVDGGGYSAYSGPITLNDGSHTVELLARDNAGWTDSASMSFQIDTVAPTTVISSPTGTTWATATIAISGVTSDPNLSSAEISYNGGGSWSGLSPDGSGNWSTTWNTQTVSNGSYSVRARGRDEAGNVGGADTVTIMVDNGEPHIYIPASWPIWQRVSINVVDNGIGVDHVCLTIHGGIFGERVYNWNDAPDDFKWDRHFGDIVAPIGGYPVEVEAWDQVGNKGAAWGEILIPAPDDVDEDNEEEPGVLSVEPPEEPQEESPPHEPPFDETDSTSASPTAGNSQPPTVVTFGDESASHLTSVANQVAPTTGSNNLLVGALAVSGISYATSLALNQRKRREEEEARKAAAAKKFNARQRALEKKRTQKIAYYRRLRNAAAAMYIASAAFAFSSVDTESTKARLQSCVNLGGYDKCFQVSPSPIMNANQACREWEQLDFCSGDPENFPRDETINTLAEKAFPMLTHDIWTGRREIYDEWVDQKTLRQNITLLLVASQDYGLDKDESAYVLATALGESKFGAITEGYYASNKEQSPMWEVTREDIANVDYAFKNGNNQPGDGYKFRGRGFCQLTGRDPYTYLQNVFGEEYGLSFYDETDLLSDPDIVAMDPRLSAEITVYGMTNGGLGTIDRGEEMGADRYIFATFDSIQEYYDCSGTDCYYHYRDIINRKSDEDNHQLYADRAEGFD